MCSKRRSRSAWARENGRWVRKPSRQPTKALAKRWLSTVLDGGHQWPGGGTEFPFLGKKSNDINSTNTLWDFFVAHPLT